jgi:nucleoid DNA-binding protein
MRKFLVVLCCWYAVAAFGLTGGEMDAGIAAQTEIPEVKVKSTLDAYEAKLKAEAAAGRAVKMEGFGTMMPRSVQGTRTGRTISGGTTTYQNWKLVKNPEIVSDKTLYAPEDEAIISRYKANAKMVMNKGGSYSSRGFGTFKLKRLAATKTKPARYTTVFNSGKTGMHQKFTPE